MAILVAGGTGFIGSHVCVQLLERGFEVVIADNLCNSKTSVVARIGAITGKSPKFYELDLRDSEALCRLFEKEEIEAAILLAGLKAVGKSVEIPLDYYENNLDITFSLLRQMEAHGVRRLVFSSSATVYGDPAFVPITEDFPLSVTNPYGRTKLMIEQILGDLVHADEVNGRQDGWSIALLRYFNPLGADESGLIGEDPNGIPNNLLPYITQVAAGKLSQLSIYGDDYNTPDGTGVRDYIHVEDLAAGHAASLAKLREGAGLYVYNLGMGHGYSVLDVIKAFEEATGQSIPYQITGRRPGDVAACYADVSKAERELGWKAEKTLAEMCASAWNWQKKREAFV